MLSGRTRRLRQKPVRVLAVQPSLLPVAIRRGLTFYHSRWSKKQTASGGFPGVELSCHPGMITGGALIVGVFELCDKWHY